MRKFLTAFLCAVLLLFAAGCAPALTPEEYSEGVRETFSDFREAMEDVAASVSDGSFDTSPISRALEALDDMAALSPPDGYAELHKKLCESMETEREWVSAAEELLKTAKDDPTNKEKLNEINERLEKLSNESEFPAAVIEIAKALKDDLNS